MLNSVKPTRLLRHLIKIGTTPTTGDIVLDFFAGSGPAGHAVLQQNSEDGGNRRYILVQIPEKLPKEEQAVKTIADLAKSRLKKAGVVAKEGAAKRLTEADNDLPGIQNAVVNIDVGFRVFKLASSNIQAWEPDRERLAETLEASVDHLKTDRTESDILFELLLKLGLDLTVPIETKSIAGQQVHSIGAGTLLVCLSKSITAKEVEPLALGIAAWHKTQAPAGESTIVFRDSAFADDVAKTNLTAILQQHGLENVRSL